MPAKTIKIVTIRDGEEKSKVFKGVKSIQVRPCVVGEGADIDRMVYVELTLKDDVTADMYCNAVVIK